MIFFKNFNIIQNNPERRATYIPDASEFECPFVLPAFAEIGAKSSSLKNDFHTLITFFPEVVTTATSKLKKCDTGVEYNVTGLGTETALGFFQNDLNQKPKGMSIDWNLVLNAHGAGCYQLIQRGTYAGGVVTEKSFVFNVKPFSSFAADETIRIEWTHTGQVGDVQDNQLIRDFAQQNWVNQIRLPESRFGRDSSQPEEEYVRYSNGEKVWTESRRIPSYELEIGFFEGVFLRYIEFDILQADKVAITDYSNLNANSHTETYVNNFGAFEPEYDPLSRLAKVTVECNAAFENHVKLRK